MIQAPAPPPLAILVARILIVDDDPSMGETLVSFLNRAGFNASSCTSASDALAFLELNGVDTIVTDLNMDGMNGIELCERVAVLRPGLPVIVMTGLGAAHARTKALGAGAYGFLTKPVDVHLLRATIDRALLSRSLRDTPPP
jgi:two-component system response regulator HydG